MCLILAIECSTFWLIYENIATPQIIIIVQIILSKFDLGTKSPSPMVVSVVVPK